MREHNSVRRTRGIVGQINPYGIIPHRIHHIGRARYGQRFIVGGVRCGRHFYFF